MVSIDPGDVVALAQMAEDGAAFERGLLALLERAVGFDVGFVESKSCGRPPALLHLDAGRMRAATPARRARYERELQPVRQVALARRGVAVDTAVLGASAVRSCAYHRDLAAPDGGKHSLLAYARVRGEYRALRERVLSSLQALLARALEPEPVAGRIVQIAESEAPGLHNPVGTWARALPRMKAWMPEAMFERGVRKRFIGA